MKIETVADRVRQVRRATTLNQEQFGKAIGVSKSAVSQWELGKTELSPDSLFAIERKFGFRAEWIASSQGPMTAEEAHYVPPVGMVNLNLESPLTPRQRALLDLFAGLTQEQQDAILHDLEATQRRNAEIFEALSRQRKVG